jgi:hypothetical protein
MNFEHRLKEYKKKAFALFPHKAFADVPVKYRTPEGACSWMSTRLSGSFTPVKELFNEIPAELVSDDLRQIALMRDAHFIQSIHPGDTDQYLDLFITAYLRGDSLIKPHPDFQTPETVERMMAYSGSFIGNFNKNPWIAEVMTPAQCEVASEQNIQFMVKFPMERVSQKALENHLKHGYGGYSALRKEGKLRLAAQYLKTGAWPTSSVFEDDQPKPQDLQDAIRIMVRGGPAVCADLYMAWVMAQPIEQVIALMTSRVLIDLAIEMYSEKELRPYLSTNRHLKAALLESTLGL